MKLKFKFFLFRLFLGLLSVFFTSSILLAQTRLTLHTNAPAFIDHTFSTSEIVNHQWQGLLQTALHETLHFYQDEKIIPFRYEHGSSFFQTVSSNKGKTIRMMKDERLIEGTLLDIQNNIFFLELADGAFLSVPDGFSYQLSFTEVSVLPVPSGVKLHPPSNKKNLRVTYEANQLNWKPQYSLMIDPSFKKGVLSGIIQVMNPLPVDLTDIDLTLSYGGLDQRGEQPSPMYMNQRSKMMASESFDAASSVSATTVADQWMMVFPKKVTLYSKSTQYLPMIEEKSRNLERSYHVTSRAYGREKQKEHPSIKVTLPQNEKQSLERALPAGELTVFIRETSGSIQKIAKTTLPMTGKNSDIEIGLGQAIDLTKIEWISDEKQIMKQVNEQTIQVELSNESDEKKVISYTRAVSLHSSITYSSIPYNNETAGVALFQVTIPKGETRTFTYTIRNDYR